ncbi:MAG: glycosyltransferase family 4 protein [Spirochaetes bacterium]|nr:glycosyltransferase family 4 protein [Spirochaetota bacterium]
MKTVCHVLPYLAEGGTEKTAYNIIRGLAHRYRMLLLAPSGRALDDFLALDVQYTAFPALKGNVIKKIKSYKRALEGLHEAGPIDLLHIHAAHEFVSFSRTVLPEVPVVFHLHSHQGSGISKCYNYRLSAFIAKRKADTLIAVSDEERRIIVENGFPADRVVVVYNGFDPAGGDDPREIERIRRENGLQGRIVIGNMGRLNRTKRLSVLIEAFRMLQRETALPVSLLIVGEGPDRARLERIARRTASGRDVVFTGYINRGDRILKIFDLFVLPTSYEGCSNVLVEAMSKALPIVTTDIPSVRWMFEQGKNALLFREDDTADLCRGMLTLIQSERMRDALSRGARERFEKYFSMDRMLRGVEEVYERTFAARER